MLLIGWGGARIMHHQVKGGLIGTAPILRCIFGLVIGTADSCLADVLLLCQVFDLVMCRRCAIVIGPMALLGVCSVGWGASRLPSVSF